MSKFFKSSYWSILWTIIRIYLGYEWITAGWGKVFDPSKSPGFIGGIDAKTGTVVQAGSSIKGFLQGAVKQSHFGGNTNPYANVQDWYAWIAQHIFIPLSPVLGYLVAFGEISVGIGLILGIFTTIALYAGAMMNLMYLLSGALSTNPQLYSLEIILLAVGASAYSIGLDRWIIPWCKEKLGMKNTPPAT